MTIYQTIKGLGCCYFTRQATNIATGVSLTLHPNERYSQTARALLVRGGSGDAWKINFVVNNIFRKTGEEEGVEDRGMKWQRRVIHAIP